LRYIAGVFLPYGQGAMKRIFLAFCVLTCLASGVRAADDASCAAAIRDAVASDGKNGVPDSCWAIGPVAIGQSQEEVRKALGPPETDGFLSSTANIWQGLMEEYRYVFPRGLRPRLKSHPIDRATFMPVTLDVDFVDGRAAALSLATTYRTGDSKCVPAQPAPHDAEIDMRFPYAFNGVAVDAPLDRFVAQFGRWTDEHAETAIDGVHANRKFTVFTYRALGLAINTIGKKQNRAVAFAIAPAHRDLAFYRAFEPYYTLSLDPQTCRVNGFTVQ
jgi:hypothetical protein